MSCHGNARQGQGVISNILYVNYACDVQTAMTNVDACPSHVLATGNVVEIV
jgi:methyl coenzyme M reductase beta subunit